MKAREITPFIADAKSYVKEMDYLGRAYNAADEVQSATKVALRIYSKRLRRILDTLDKQLES
jgi:hypothetical protein